MVSTSLLLCCGHLTETLSSWVSLDVASQTASMQQSHVETSYLNHPSLIVDAIRLQSLRIKTFAHWEPGAEHAFSAAAGFSAVRLAASLFVFAYPCQFYTLGRP